MRGRIAAILSGRGNVILTAPLKSAVHGNPSGLRGESCDDSVRPRRNDAPLSTCSRCFRADAVRRHTCAITRARFTLSRALVGCRLEGRRAIVGDPAAGRKAKRGDPLETPRAWLALEFRADAIHLPRHPLRQRRGLLATFEGKRIDYRPAKPGAHYDLIVAATQQKILQNPEVRKVLLGTGDLILKPDHHQEPNAPAA